MKARLLRRTARNANGLPRKRMKRGLRLWLSTMLLVLILASGGPSYSPGSNVFATDTVCVAVSELDSLYAGVDTLLLERRLLQIDLLEVRRIAQADSLMFEDRLEIYRAREKSWLTKALSHPAIWFMIGAYAGLQAAR